MRTPPTAPGPSHVLFDHFWVETGGAPLPEGRESDGKGGSFVLTPTVTQHLRNLARAVLLRRYPILLQASGAGRGAGRLWAGCLARGGSSSHYVWLCSCYLGHSGCCEGKLFGGRG